MAARKASTSRFWRGLSRGRKWWLASGIVALLCVLGLFIAALLIGRHFEPYIRAQAIQYLEQRFESEVELQTLRVRVPNLAVLRLLGSDPTALVKVEGENLSMRYQGRQDVPPMFVLRKFQASVNLRTVFENPKVVPLVTLEGMEINIPPKGDRPDFGGDDKPTQNDEESRSGVIIENVAIYNAKLSILPRDKSKVPLRFDLHEVRLQSAGKDIAMTYRAVLRNPKPPGEIQSQGTFGPWSAEEPSNTRLAGTYLFDHADLGIFNGISGILRSTGQFEGRLGSITARGEASVPDFRLKSAGNIVPLTTTFEVLVDGTNGNTTLKPVRAQLGSTHFTTSGVVIKNDGDTRKTISLDVSMPAGNMRDLLTLSTKESPFMEGMIALKARIGIPPLTGRVKEKLLLDGTFNVTKGKFLRTKIQDQIDGLSRKAQGQPDNQEIDEVISHMTGTFDLRSQVMTFRTLAFSVPGAAVNIAGTYDMGEDQLDFHGALALDAKVSQTQSGWKRWVLKPLDPFFSKNGAGTFLKIKILGSPKNPQFGRDR